MSTDQIHSRIKMFSGQLSQDGTLPLELRARVADFASGPTVCARSVGVEFLESRDIALVSVGYSEEPGEPVAITSVKVGQLFEGEDIDLEKIGAQMSEAAASFDGVICHEFYVTGDGSVFVVFLVRR